MLPTMGQGENEAPTGKVIHPVRGKDKLMRNE